jgi:urease accessory protein
VKVDLPRMIEEAKRVRAGRPVLLTNCHTGEGVDAVADLIADHVLFR